MIPVNDLRRHAEGDRAEAMAAAQRVYDSGWYILGPEVAAFEQAFAEYLGVAHVIGVANGTDALEIAMKAVGVEAGDHVLMTANAGGYAATAACLAGAVPVFCDVRADALIDASSAAAAVTPRTRAVVATHLYGQMCDVAALRRALPQGLAIIEDCAQAHGARLEGVATGALGDVAAFSFYPTKNLAAIGDGGAVATANPSLAATAGSLRTYGWAARYEVARAGGRNTRLDELQAAVLRARLAHLDGRNTRRREIAARYRSASPHLVLGRDDESYVGHLCVMVTDRRDDVRAELAAAGVATDVHYPIPDHRQQVWSAPRLHLPVTERLCAEVLTLPCFPELTDGEVDVVCAALESLS